MDEADQFASAKTALSGADRVVISTVVFCEFVWVLTKSYKYQRNWIEDAIDKLLNASNVTCDRTVIETGLVSMRAGAGFADGVIAAEAARVGAQFVSFDQRAVKVVGALGIDAATPGV